MGVGGDAEERIEQLVDANVDVVVVDTAHGHSEGVIQTVEEAKKKYPDPSVRALVSRLPLDGVVFARRRALAATSKSATG